MYIAACSRSHPPPPPPCATIAGSGDATFYAADGTGACSFAGGDRMVAALNGADFGHAALCGACLDVASGAKHVVVRIVDSCPGCKHGDLDLSKEAFAQLADPDRGRIPITWRVVACDVTGPIAYRFKDGSNPYWTGIQIENHRYPIAKLESWTRDGVVHDLRRADYNYFVAQGLGPGRYAFRAVDAFGHALFDLGVPLAPEKAVSGAAQFPTCP